MVKSPLLHFIARFTGVNDQCSFIHAGVTQHCLRCLRFLLIRILTATIYNILQTRMWANAQRDGRPAGYRWRPLLNAAMSG